MMPIPRFLLPDTCTVEQPDTSGAYGDAYEAACTMAHVRYEPDVARLDRAWADDESITGALYIDARNTVGAFAPEPRARIRINVAPDGTAEYEGHVRDVKPVKDIGSSPHHWEVALG